MTEVVHEDRNGFSFPPGDAQALSKVIVDILDHPSRLIRIYGNPEVKTRSTSDYIDEVETEYLKARRGYDRGNIFK
jgi:hypothetical protein